jgi:tRNA(fMet)-specific endonuclease VapC
MRYLLDTNIVSELIRNPQGSVTERVREVGESQVATSKGQPIGGNDLLIAAQALSLGFTLVTANEREFAKIDDLPCENWLA